MRLAIMQPYIFPYIGYFQLIDSVDKFVIYDDVNFIKRGWVNRNNILVNGKPHMFSLPLVSKSQNTIIKDMKINSGTYISWREKFFKTISHAYSKSRNFKDGMSILEKVLIDDTSLVQMCERSLDECSKYLGIETELCKSSSIHLDYSSLNKADKLIKICNTLGASEYVNSPGGKELYEKNYFSSEGIELFFLVPNVKKYKQHKSESFSSHMSIIDVIMNNSQEECRSILMGYQLE